MSFSIWWRLFRAKYGLTCAFWIFIEGILLATVMPLLPIALSTKIGMDKEQVTLYFLITTLLATVITLVTGYLSDGSIARYKLVLICGFASAIGYFGIATATLPMHAYLAGLLVVALGVIFPQLFAVAKSGVVADWEAGLQTTAITALRTLFSLGFVIGTALGSALTHILDIQLIFLLMSVAVIGLTVGVGLFMYQIEGYIARREAAGLAGLPTEENTAISEKLKRSAVSLPIYALVMPLLALIVLRGADSTRSTYISLVMLQLFGDASIGPTMFGLTAAAELIAMPVLGDVAHRIGERNAIAIGALFGLIYFVVMATSQNLTVLYFMQIPYAVFIAAMVGTAMAYVQRMLTSRAGLGGSVYMAVFNIGSLVGILAPLLVAGYSPLIFVAPAVMCVVGGLMLLFGDRTKEIEQRLRQALSNETEAQNTLLQPVPPLAVEGEV
jgi:SET family sugar efflux transporter-like MFS transporter